MPRYNINHIRTDKDRVKLFHTMVNMINKTIKDASRTDYIVLNIVKQLNKEDIIYNGKYYNFEEFISKLEQDTREGIIFNAKIRDSDQLKTILVKIFATIQKIIGKKEITKELERFLETEHEGECNDIGVTTFRHDEQVQAKMLATKRNKRKSKSLDNLIPKKKANTL